jgi:MFS family permease
MMGLDIPASAFGSAWADYRIFAGLNAVVLLALLLLGGVLGDAFGRRRVLLLGAGGDTLANVLALVAPNPPLFVAGRPRGNRERACSAAEPGAYSSHVSRPRSAERELHNLR